VRPDLLRENPLLWSKLVNDQVEPQADIAARVACLQRQVKRAVEPLGANPKDLRLYRALYHTYVQPAPTQEQASELLDVPFSSYRRHLKEGIQRVVQALWLAETGAG
jgi:hypothetical protein